MNSYESIFINVFNIVTHPNYMILSISDEMVDTLTFKLEVFFKTFDSYYHNIKPIFIHPFSYDKQIFSKLFEIVYIKRGDDYKNIDLLIESVSDDNYKNAFKICKFAIQLSVFIREDLAYYIENELSTNNDLIEQLRRSYSNINMRDFALLLSYIILHIEYEIDEFDYDTFHTCFIVEDCLQQYE